MRTRKLLPLFSLVCSALGINNSFAAEASFVRDAIPGSVQPALIGQQLPKTPVNKAPPKLPAVAKMPTSALPAEAQKIKFKLIKLNIIGNTIYKSGQLTSLYQSYLGKVISLADLQTISDNITKRYREDGYLLSKAIIPAQKISNGVVTIQVVEGYIANVVIAGQPTGSRHLLEAYTQHLTQYQPINIATLERYILLANDIPGLDVRTVLSPAQNTATNTVRPGATQATFIADEHKANAYLTYDNRGTVYLGPFQYSFGASVNSALRSGDQTTFQGLVTSNTNELQFYRLNHQTPLGSDGLMLNLATSYNTSHPGSTLKILDLTGRSFIYSAGLTYPLIRSRAESLFVTGTFDSSRSTSSMALLGTLYVDKIRSLRLGGTYNKADSWYGVNQIGTQLSQGLQIFGASKNGQSNELGQSTLSRAAGQSNYTKINLDASRLQYLGASNFSVLAAMQGQYAFCPLLIAEQFTYGGSQFGLAYDPAQFTGDHGVTGKVELRYDSNPNWRLLKYIQYFTFYDFGKVWNKNGNTPNVATNGSSLGVGFRTQVNQYVSAHLEWAKPLTAPAGGTAILSNNPRIFFGVTIAGDTGGSLATASTQVPVQAYRPLG